MGSSIASWSSPSAKPGAAVRRPARRRRTRARPRATLAALRFATLAPPAHVRPDARERWIEVYGPLSRGEAGLARRRDPPRRSARRPPRRDLRHPGLQRADRATAPRSRARGLALQPDSARWIFGDSLGDPTADEIWDARQRPPAASPAARSATCSHATRKPARSTAPSPSSKKPDASPAQPSDGRGRPAEAGSPRRMKPSPRPRRTANPDPPSHWTWAEHRAGRRGCHRAKRGQGSEATLTAPPPAPPSSKCRGGGSHRPVSAGRTAAPQDRLTAHRRRAGNRSFRSYPLTASRRRHLRLSRGHVNDRNPQYWRHVYTGGELNRLTRNSA